MPRGPGTWHTNEHSVPPTYLEETRQMEPELAFWSKFAGAQAAQVYYFCASVTTVYLFFFDIERVLTRLARLDGHNRVVLLLYGMIGLV